MKRNISAGPKSSGLDWHDLISSFAIGGLGGALGTSFSISRTLRPGGLKHHAIWGGGTAVANIIRQAALGKLDAKNVIGGLLASSLGYAAMSGVTQALTGKRIQEMEEIIKASLQQKKKENIFTNILNFLFRRKK